MMRKTTAILTALPVLLVAISLATAHVTSERAPDYMRDGTIRAIDLVPTLVSSQIGAHFYDAGITFEIDAGGVKNAFRFVVHHAKDATPQRLERIKSELGNHRSTVQEWLKIYMGLQPKAQTWQEVKLHRS